MHSFAISNRDKERPLLLLPSTDLKALETPLDTSNNPLNKLASLATRLPPLTKMITPPPTKPGTPLPVNVSKDLPASVPIDAPRKFSSRYYRKLAEQGTPSKRQRIGPSCDKCRVKKIKCNASVEVVVDDTRIMNLFGPFLHHELTDLEVDEFNNKWSGMFGNVLLPHRIMLADELFEKKRRPRKKRVMEDGQLEDNNNNNNNNDENNNNNNNNNENDTNDDNKDNKDNKSEIEPVKYQIVIKHLDKLIIFQSCSSCNKRKFKHVDGGPRSCKFARGFSRPDINAFNKVKNNMMINNPSITKNSPIYSLTTKDYLDAGFQIDPL